MKKVKIRSIKKLDNQSHERFDITVDNNHNYFANNILIHNCNSFYRHDGEQLYVKSRNFYKRKPEVASDDLWWEIAIELNFEDKLKKIPDYGVFGEVYGHVTPFYYDCKIVNGKIKNKFRAFDIYDFKNNKFLDYDEMVNICSDLEIEMAPLVYRGPLTIEHMYELCETDSRLKSNLPKSTNIMEGLVIRPEHERTDRYGRVIVKLKSERYNLFK